jgi:pimeloyl-ACP methyl ester carboxylesterase
MTTTDAVQPGSPRSGPDAVTRARLAALRAGFGALDRISPERAGRGAFRLWLRLPDNAGRRKDFRPRPGRLSQVTTVRGTRIAVETWSPQQGGDEAPVVYLVHGWGGWRGQLGGLVDPLLERGLRVVAFDAPSHGESGPSSLGPRRGTVLEAIEAFAAVGASFGEAHGVAAHSMGSTVAAIAARAHAPTARRLALIAPNHDFTAMSHELAATLGISEAARVGMQRQVEAFAGQPMSNFDLAPLGADGLLPPTLVVHDRDDKEVPHRVGVTVAETWPEAELLTTTGLGHQRILTDPLVLAAVGDHLTA